MTTEPTETQRVAVWFPQATEAEAAEVFKSAEFPMSRGRWGFDSKRGPCLLGMMVDAAEISMHCDDRVATSDPRPVDISHLVGAVSTVELNEMIRTGVASLVTGAPVVYGDPATKFGQARTALMAPHREGEDASFAYAFRPCSEILFDLAKKGSIYLDADAERWIEIVRRTIDCSGIEERGDWGALAKVRTLTTDQKEAFACAVDALADWFWIRFL